MFDHVIDMLLSVLLSLHISFSSVISENENITQNLPLLYDHDIKSTVVFSTVLNQKSFNLKNAPHRRLSFTKDRFSMFSPVFIFRKKSILTPVCDHQIQLFREAGLIDL